MNISKIRKIVLSEEQSILIKKNDIVILCVLTLLYAVIALINLGTLCFPVSVYRCEAPDTISISFSNPVDIDTAWINHNIRCSSFTVFAEDGEEAEYVPDEGGMFQWNILDINFSSIDTLSIQTTSGVALNEIAFFSKDGDLIPYTVTSEVGAEIGDEQDTVPDHPSYYNGMYFDEIYHARTAYEFLNKMSVYEWTHPPLGKILISVGIAIFGMKPFGWRVIGALFGVAMVPLMFIFGKRLFKRTDYALLTAGLMTFDSMHYTQTRIATIDVFGVFFIILMFFFMYEFLRKPLLNADIKSLLKPLLFSGLSFGIGCSCKWIGCYAGAGLAVLLFSHLIYTARTINKETAIAKKNYRKRLISILLYCIVFFVIFPCIIYYASYIPFFLHEVSVDPNYGFSDTFTTLLNNQRDMYSYHSTLTATHLCQSKWYQWPFTSKSVWFYVGTVGNKISNISSTGNPAVWWICSVGTFGLFLERIMGKIKKSPAFSLIFVGIIANYLPWILVDRCVFLYHFFATVPFIIFGGVFLLYHLEEEKPSLACAKWIWLGFAVLYFVLLLPAASGFPTSRQYASFLENVLPSSYLYYGWA